MMMKYIYGDLRTLNPQKSAGISFIYQPAFPPPF